jgi:hypothetical protein
VARYLPHAVHPRRWQEGAVMRHVISGVILLLASPAHAAPPPDADPKLAPWYNSLRLPESTMPCCSMADCQTALSRLVQGHYEVLIEGNWVAVPDDKVLTRPDNPTGEAVVCWTPYSGVLCFVKAPES